MLAHHIWENEHQLSFQRQVYNLSGQQKGELWQHSPSSTRPASDWFDGGVCA